MRDTAKTRGRCANPQTDGAVDSGVHESSLSDVVVHIVARYTYSTARSWLCTRSKRNTLFIFEYNTQTSDAELLRNLQRSLPHEQGPGCCLCNSKNAERVHVRPSPNLPHELYTNYSVPQNNGRHAPKPV